MPFAIEADTLIKTFKGKHEVRALDGVSFNVEEGRVFGLLGPNGSGKTTAVRVLTTILKPDGGSARVLGHDVVKKAGLVRSLIGLAGQYAAVDENLTGRENLQMVGNLNHLERTTVSGRAALVARPTVLFLDEPTTGLDPQSRNDLWEVIENLVGEGTTVLLTTQYLEEADRLASILAVLDHGHVIAEGTPAELKADLGATVLEVGLSTTDDASRTARILDALGPHTAVVNGTVVEVTVDEGPTSAMAGLRSLDQEGIVPTAFTLREPSLDDVFLALTGRRTEDESEESHDPDQAPGNRALRQAADAMPIATGELS